MADVSQAAVAHAASVFCPTSSSALAQHRCVRVLWLSLSACLHMVAAPARTAAAAALRSTSSRAYTSHTTTEATTTTTSSTSTRASSSSVPRTANNSFAQQQLHNHSVSGSNSSELAAALCGLDVAADGRGWLYGDDDDGDNDDDDRHAADAAVHALTRRCSLRSGYELRLRDAVEQRLLAQEQEQQRARAEQVTTSSATAAAAAASAGSEHTSLQLRLHDVMGSSRWEKLDTHRALMAVVVVVNVAPAMAAAASSSSTSVDVDARVAMAHSAAMAEVVHTVFDAHFADCVCRCVVIGASRELQATLQTRYGDEFVCVAQSTAVARVARDLVDALQQRITAALRRTLQRLQPPSLQIHSSSSSSKHIATTTTVDASIVYTPLDKPPTRSHAATLLGVAVGSVHGSSSHNNSSSGSTAVDTTALRRSALASRLAKKRGDVLLQLGACDAALLAYGDTHFASGVDPLWCSATLESIAAVRYEQQRAVREALPLLNDLLLRLQSDAARPDDVSSGEYTSVGGAATTTTTRAAAAAASRGGALAQLAHMERVLLPLPEQLSRALAVCVRGASVPRSMRQRLLHDVYEPLSERVAVLRGLLARTRAALQRRRRRVSSGSSAGGDRAATADDNNDNDDDDDDVARDASRTGRELKQCVEAVVRLALREVDVYLHESLRQLRKVTHNTTGDRLRDRELERQLKVLAYCVDRGDRAAFARERAATRALLLMLQQQQHEAAAPSHAAATAATAAATSVGVPLCDVAAVHRVLVYLVALCVCAGYRRTAVAGLVELGTGNVCSSGHDGVTAARTRIRPATAQRMLWRACVLSGVDVAALRLRVGGVDDEDNDDSDDDDSDDDNANALRRRCDTSVCSDPLLRLYRLVQQQQQQQEAHGNDGSGGGTDDATAASALDLSTTFAMPEQNDSRHATSAATTTATATTIAGAQRRLRRQHAPDYGTNRRAEQRQSARTLHVHVALLRALLDVLREAAAETSSGSIDDNDDDHNNDNDDDAYSDHSRTRSAASAACVRVAGMLLCRYHSYLSLDASQQALLLRVVAAHALPPRRQRQHVSMWRGRAYLTTTDVPFLLRWEALPLPAHLAPKTVSLGGPFFTFIDTQRLKLTVLCLNGRRLRSRVVWTVGDAGAVLLTLHNPLHCTVTVASLALCCRHRRARDDTAAAAADDDDDNNNNKSNSDSLQPQTSSTSPSCGNSGGGGGGDDDRRRRRAWLRLVRDAETTRRRPRERDAHAAAAARAPTSYTLTDVTLAPHDTTRVVLKVQPNAPGSVVIDGVELSLASPAQPLLPPALPLRARLPEAMTIPVLPRLPHVCCTLPRSEIEVFARQCVDLVLRIVNCGDVALTQLTLTTHSEACQLDDCEGCRERASRRDGWVVLDKAALTPAALSRRPLRPGDALLVRGVLHAPAAIAHAEAHALLFRVDCALPYVRPTMPANVPSAVPVFGVIPRRVTQTRLRVFYAPGVVVVSVTSSRDRRFAHVRVANRSTRYSVELQLGALPFAPTLPSAFLVAGAEYVVPPLELARIAAYSNSSNSNDGSGSSRSALCYAVPWVVRELADCYGDVDMDFSVVARDMVVCAELLDDCVLSADVYLDDAHDTHASVWCDGAHDTVTHNNDSSSRRGYRRNDTSTTAAATRRGDVAAAARVWHWESRATTGGSASTTWSCVMQREAHSPWSLSSPQQQQQQLLARVQQNHGDDERSDSHDAVLLPSAPPHQRQHTDKWGGAPSDDDDEGDESEHASATATAAAVTTATAAPRASESHSGSGACVSATCMVLPLLTPVRVRVRATALSWRRALELRVRVTTAAAATTATAATATQHNSIVDDDDDEALVVSGMTDCRARVGAQGSADYDGELELVALTPGAHALHFVITDDYEREVTHTMRFRVAHANMAASLLA